MISIVWKELRENFRWALLAMVVLGAAEVHALYASSRNGMVDYYDFYQEGITLTKKSFLTITTFGCAAIGFLLGLIQILPELKRDRWAALLHRPVSRGLIFRGKVAAGLLLYALAVVPPFLFSTWLVATPGHFSAPFTPEMVFPGTADLCTGVVYYFAALAVALQRGGWIGLRLFPLGAATFSSYFASDERHFHVVIEATVLMALALFTAAWGEVHNQQLLRQRPWLGKVAFLAVIFYGVVGVVYYAKFFLLALVPTSAPNFEQYDLSDEGVPLHFIYAGDGTVLHVLDMAGKPVTDPRFKPDRVRNHVMYLNTFSQNIGNSHGYRTPQYRPTYRESQAYLWANNPYSYPRMEIWFQFVKRKYLIGYHPEQKQAFAILDQRGFEPPTAVPQVFPADTTPDFTGRANMYLHSPWRIQYVHLDKREIGEIPLPAPGPIYGFGNAFASSASGTSVDVIGVTLRSGLAVYDSKNLLVALLPYHQDMDRWGCLSLGINGALDRFYLRYDPSAWQSYEVKKSMPSYVEVMTAQGQVLQTYTLPPLPNHGYPRSWDTFLSQRLQTPVFYFGTMVYKKIGALLGSKRLQGDLKDQFGHGLPVTKEFSAYILSLSTFLAVVTFFWARRMQFPPGRAWAWAAFVFGFNLLGFITFRLTADWPRFISCPTCGKRRPVEMETCPHCGSEWPAPAVNGTEIIREEPAVAAV